MLRDYRPKKKKQPEKKASSQHKIKVDQKIIFSIVLVLLVIFLTFLIIKTVFNNLYRLKDSERILLIKNQQPVAILFFDVENKQIISTDLRENNFDLSGLAKEASLSSNLKKNLVYAFLFNTTFDQSLEYSYDDLSRENLLALFKNQKEYYFFLKDKELFWREQNFQRIDDATSAVEPIFNCPIALINTTEEAGLANSLATIFKRNSFSIIKKDSNSDNLAQTRIVYNEQEPACQSVLNKLSKILPESRIEANQAETLTHRAALVIYIGTDLADLYVFFVNLFHSQI
jgi:hypothetical protein